MVWVLYGIGAIAVLLHAAIVLGVMIGAAAEIVDDEDPHRIVKIVGSAALLICGTGVAGALLSGAFGGIV